MQKRILPIAVLSLLSFNTYSLDSSGSGVMKLILPATGSGVGGSALTKNGVVNIKSQSFLVPGEILISARRQCGDGDVARYQKSNPTFSYNLGDEEKVKHVFGYWLTPESDSSVPTNENWIPIFYNDLTISGAGGDFRPNSKLGGVPGLVPTLPSQKNLAKVLQSRLQILFGKTLERRHRDELTPNRYRFHAASLICVNYKNPSVATTDSLTSHDIAYSFVGNDDADFENALGLNSLLLTNPLDNVASIDALSSLELKADVSKKLNPENSTATSSGFPLTVVKASSGSIPLTLTNLSSSKFYQAAKEVLQLTWNVTDPQYLLFKAELDNPSATGSTKDAAYLNYTKNINSPLFTKLKDLKDLMADSSKKCKDWTYDSEVLSNQNDKYWYFPVKKMNLECKLLSNSITNNSYTTKVKELFMISTYDEASFNTKRKALAELLFKVAVLQKAQTIAHNSLDNNEKISCFDSDSSSTVPYVNTILNAGALITVLDPTNNKLKLTSPVAPIHHEYSFAISSAIQTDYATNHQKILFSSRANGDSDAKIDLDAQHLPGIDASLIGKIGIDLTVRSLYGSSCVGQIVCLNTLLGPSDNK